ECAAQGLPMPEPPTPFPEDLDVPVSEGGATPLHGYRGAPDAPAADVPRSLTIAISREAGARGATIAQRVGAKLGWQVYGQDLLEYMAQEGTFRRDVLEQLPPGADAWVECQLQRLLREQNLSANPSILELARIILLLAAQGEAV